MTYSSSITLRSALFIFACLFQTAASAEAKVGDRFGDWVFECRALAADVNICALTLTILHKKNNRPHVKLSLMTSGGKKEQELHVLLPLGIHLPSGVSAAVGQDKPFPLTVQNCTQQGCMATVKVDSTLLKTMQSGDKLTISFSRQPAANPIVVEGSLKGLAEGLKAIGHK